MNFNGDNTTFVVAAGASVTITGSNDTIIYGDGASISLTGSYDTLSPASSSVTGAFFAFSAGDLGLALNATDAQVRLSDDATLTLVGSGDATTLSGDGATLVDNGSQDLVALSGDSNIASIYGQGAVANSAGVGDLIKLYGGGESSEIRGNGSWSDVYANGDLVTENGTNDYSTVWQGRGNQIVSNGAGDQIGLQSDGNTGDIYGNNTASYSLGSSDLIRLHGAGESSTIIGVGSWADIYGSNDSVVENGTNDYSTVWQGSGNQIVSNGVNDQIGLQSNGNTGDIYGGNTASYSLGAGDLIRLHGSADESTINGIGSWADCYGMQDSVIENGTNDYSTVWQGNGDTVASYGVNDQIGLQSNGNTGDIYGVATASYSLGSGDLIRLHGTADTSTIDGAGSWADMYGTQESVTENGVNDYSTVWQGYGDQATSNGANDQIGLQTSGNTAYVNGASALYALAGGALFVGSGGAATLSGSGMTINLANSATLIANGGNETVNLSSADTVTFSGHNNNVVNGYQPGDALLYGAGAFQITPIFAAGVSSDFEQAVALAIGWFEANIADNMSITIAFTETSGSGSFLAENTDTYDSYAFSYSQIVAALTANASSPVQRSALAALPATNPFGSSSFHITNVEAQLLNLPTRYYSYNGQSVSGLVTLNSTYNFNYTQSNIQSTQYDAVAALEHEVSEVLGRVEFTTSSTTFYPSIEGLQIYTAPRQIDTTPLTSGQSPYFSVDGGQTNLGLIDEAVTPDGGDIADWSFTSPPDAFGFGAPGQIEPISSADLAEIQALGYHLSD